MENYELFQASPVITFRDNRENIRHQAPQFIAITPRGTGQIIDISHEGLSFGCLYPHTFPLIMKIDILGADGTFIKGLHVIKCWSITDKDTPAYNHKFEITVGFEFVNLNSGQSFEIAELVKQLSVYAH